MSNGKSRLIALLALLCCVPSTVDAQILLVVDDSDPSNVTFTATGLSPSIEAPFIAGGNVSLLDFYSSDISGTYSISATTSTLSATNGSFDYNTVGTGIVIPIGSYNDLTLNSKIQANTEFDPATPAFSGTASFDFNNSGFASLIPAPGSSGFLETDAGLADGTIIGQWSVVSAPEPKGWELLVLAAGTFLWLRNRPASSRSLANHAVNSR